jgi:hypothetical protein
MNFMARSDVRKLLKDPLSFAIMMEDEEIEHVIVNFVAVLNKRKTKRGGQN